MNSKATWLLLFLAGGLFAFILFVERPAREAREQKTKAFLFSDLNMSNVTALKILPEGRFEIAAEKSDDIWQLRKPVSYPANREFIEALITNLTALQWRTHITAEELRMRPNAQEEFGLDTPQFSIKIQTDTFEQQLLVGSKSVIGDEVFVQFVGGDGVYLVDAEWMNLLPRRYEDWRDPSVMPTGILAATGVEVRSGTRGFKLDLNPTNLMWRLTRPIEARANHAKVSSLLTNLAGTRIAAYIAEESMMDLENFGLPSTPGQPPQLELTFLHGTNLIAGLQIGNALTNAPGHVFAKHLDRDSVFVVPKEPFDAWLAPHIEFRNRRLVRFGTNRVEKFEVRGAEEFSIVRQSDGKWMVNSAENFVADAEGINDLLFALSNVEIAFENDVVTDFSAFGLTNPIVDYSISGVMTNALIGKEEIIIEQLRFGTNESGKVFVRRNDESRVYSIHQQEFSLMPRFAWQLADKQIWNFAPTNVISVTVEQQGRTRKILRSGDNEWSVAPGSQGIINPHLLEEAMHRLGKLQAVFWSARGEASNDPFGIKKNDFQITIEIERSGKRELLPIRFGHFSDFKMPYAEAVLQGKPAVFEFPLPLYLEFIRRDLSIVPAPLPPQ